MRDTFVGYLIYTQHFQDPVSTLNEFIVSFRDLKIYTFLKSRLNQATEGTEELL